MIVKVAIVNAFVDGLIDAEDGGNPAGVVLDADVFTDQQKLDIAKKVGLSETAFISKSKSADFKLDFFTPQKQIAHCGHDTIAAFSYLAKLGLIVGTTSSKETIDGIRQVDLVGDVAYMEQLSPKYLDIKMKSSTLLDALGLTECNTVSLPKVVNTGNSFLLVGVNSIDELEAIQPDLDVIAEVSEQHDLIGFYVYTLETNIIGRDASARMFAPRYGITEESATGMAAGPLACYLYEHMDRKQSIFQIEQGYSMKPKSPSCIEVVLNLKDGRISSLKSGGVGVVSQDIEVEI